MAILSTSKVRFIPADSKINRSALIALEKVICSQCGLFKPDCMSVAYSPGKKANTFSGFVCGDCHWRFQPK